MKNLKKIDLFKDIFKDKIKVNINKNNVTNLVKYWRKTYRNVIKK